MRASLRFRHRIGLLVALAAMGLVTVTVVTLVLGRQSELQLRDIETRYVPLIELDRDLNTTFAQIPRVLEDAAAAAEDSGLAEADRLEREFLRRLHAGHDAIADNGGDPQALEREFRAYYAIAREVSAAMVAGTRVPDLVDRIERMRRAQQQVTARLDASTSPDRKRLAAAFATARASQRYALRIEIIVGLGALALMALLSWQLIRRTVRSLHAVSVGVEEIARGEFGHEIDVASEDEIGDLAREANRTAVRLREYRERTQTLLEETRRQAEELRHAHHTLEARNATLEAARQLLEERADELARASRYKSEFLANMSHELRTPLNSIMILSQLLATNADGHLTEQQVDFATVIHKSGEELLALINEVLDLAKVEAGKQALAFAALPIGQVAEYARRMFQPLAAEKNLAFGVETAGELPAHIRTDWSRLAQILKNLIANAFKFTESGRVAVRVARPSADQRARFIDPAITDPFVISVSDTGIGIAADQHAFIFEAFAQAETGTTRKFGGTGLGLTIAKQLAIRLGGDLYLESEIGEGSTFHVVLPIAGPVNGDAPAPHAEADAAAAAPATRSPAPVTAPPPPPPRAEPAPDADSLLDGRTVLIVDDDMRNVYSLSSTLRGKNLHIITATDGQEALDELERHPDVDVVLMDVMMPGMNGHEATRRIRAQDRFRELPIIATTARTMPGEREQCIAAGASDYLAKPVDLDHLLGLLRTWLK